MVDNSRLIENAGASQVFILGGNSRFTIVSKDTGRRFTYRVRRKTAGVYFVSVLTGSDNENDYNFIGTLFSGRSPYRHGRKANIKETAPAVVAFKWVWDKLTRGILRTDAIEIWHEGRCCRCARPLTDPASIDRGIGPECSKY